MYVCMYVCMYVSMDVSMYLWMYLWMYMFFMFLIYMGGALFLYADTLQAPGVRWLDPYRTPSLSLYRVHASETLTMKGEVCTTYVPLNQSAFLLVSWHHCMRLHNGIQKTERRINEVGTKYKVQRSALYFVQVKYPSEEFEMVISSSRQLAAWVALVCYNFETFIQMTVLWKAQICLSIYVL